MTTDNDWIELQILSNFQYSFCFNVNAPVIVRLCRKYNNHIIVARIFLFDHNHYPNKQLNAWMLIMRSIRFLLCLKY